MLKAGNALFRKFLMALFILAEPAASLPFYLPGHDFVPPTSFGIYGGLNISSQRGPCPGLNTLANHGYINRNGSDITFQSIEKGAEEAYGFPKQTVQRIISSFFAIGMKHVGENKNGDKTINLFDLYDGGQHDASAVRDDPYFNKYAQFNETLFQMLISNEKDGSITFDDAVDHISNQIINSRKRNPEFYLEFSDVNLASNFYARETLALFALGDADTITIQTDKLRMFLQENRIPEDYVPVHNENSVTTLDLNVEADAPEIIKAFEVDVDLEANNSEHPRIGLIVGLVLGGIGVMVISVQAWCLVPKKQKLSQEMEKSVSTRASISTRPGFSGRKSLVSNRVAPKDLVWDNITVKTQDDIPIASNLCGQALSGQVTGLLGHSGSGKTTLLKMLQGKAKSLQSKKLTVEGKIYVNGKEVEQSVLSLSQHLAFVAQDDVLVETATPKEAIRFAARMRLPKRKSNEYVDDITEQILNDLRLTGVQDRVMNDKNGLSGGEKRRVSFGLAMVTQPSILLLDEVTSGVDSYSASQIVDICHHLAHVRGTSILMSMHQPSKQMVSKIDRIMLLRSGNCMFELPTSDVETKFLDAGYPVPEDFTDVDWALEVSQQRSFEELKNNGFFNANESTFSEDKVNHFGHDLDVEESAIKNNTGRTLDSTLRDGEISENHKEKHERISLLFEVKQLAIREMQYILRSWKLQATKCVIAVALSLLFIFFAWQLAPEALDSPENFSATVGVIFLTVQASCIVLLLEGHETAVERLTFAREYSTGHYRLISYALVKTVFGSLLMWPLYLSGLTIIFFTAGSQGRFWYMAAVAWLYLAVNSALGRAVTGIPKNPFDAQVLKSSALFPQVILCGFLVSYNAMPGWSRWLLWVNPMTYAFRLGLGEEFRRCTDFTPKEQEVVNCVEAINGALESGRSIYDDESVLNVVQVGTSKGEEAIIEYFGYMSYDGVNRPLAGFHDMCQHKDTLVVRLNSAEKGICDISVADTRSVKLNPSLHKNKETLVVKFALGHRIQFNYPEDLSYISIKQEALYYPDTFLSESFGQASQSAIAATTCIAFEGVCPDVFKANGFGSSLDCIGKMTDDIPIMTTSEETGLVVIDANSTVCRHLHASLAVTSPETHCPHVSFIPMEDPNGATKCSKGYNRPYEDFFDKKDMTLFEQSAIKGGLDVESRLSVSNKEVDRAECGLGDSNSAFFSDQLPGHFECYRYLHTQFATGEQQTEYWVALTSFFVFFQCLGFLLFANKSRL